MSSSPQVTVCLPTYNGGLFLEDCLASLAQQSGVAVEVVLRDDCSSDQTLQIAKATALKFPQLNWNIQRNSQRLGMVQNWNACLKAATGEFVKVMGQDDLLLPGCLSKQVQALRDHPSAALTVSAAQLYSAKGAKLFSKRRHWSEGFHSGQEIIHDCARRAYNPLGEPVTGLARREKMLSQGGYDESLRYWVDVEMWFQLIEDGGCVLLREALCGFRIHRGAASFTLQGDSYAEFLQVANDYAPPESVISGRSFGQRLRAGVDSAGLLAIYRLFG